MIFVAFYLLAVTAANMVASLGPWHSVLSAFVLIGATLTTRDRIHERWAGRGLVVRMACLIAAAGVLTVLINRSAARIALESCVAFVVSESVDAAVYHLMRGKGWTLKVNGSNAVSALVDSVLFPTIAFGAFMPAIMAAQYVVKVLGGSLWGWELRPSMAVVVFLLATPSYAQIVSANAVWLHNAGVSAPAAEVFVSAPAIKGVRPYAIAS